LIDRINRISRSLNVGLNGNYPPYYASMRQETINL
jgi:hypothetical protein